MKKTLAMLLAVLVALSMFSVAAFAADDLVKITFLADDGTTVIREFETTAGKVFTGAVPEDPAEPVNPEDGYRYTFKGWQSSVDEKIYYKGTMNPVSQDVTYTAVFSKEEVKPTQSLLNFFESIFERINAIFQYFAEIFRFDR